MRGVAALVAAGAVWILIVGTGRLTMWHLPRVSVRVVATSVLAGVAGAVVSFGLLGTIVPAAAIGVLCSGIPARHEQSRIERNRSERADQWPDFIAFVRASVAAGATLPDAFIDGSDRIGGEFASYGDVVRHEVLYGSGFGAALTLVRREVNDPIADRVLSTLTIAHRTGGHKVGKVLAALGVSVADEIRLRKAHDAALTEQRWTATVALIAPWGLLALSIATNPQAAVAFNTAEGIIVVVGGLAATGMGWVLARRASRLSASPRLFV